jgi:excisionase family DNA binding protein
LTVEEAARKLGKSKWAIYKMIKEKRGIGPKFVYRVGDGWFIYAKDVRGVS